MNSLWEGDLTLNLHQICSEPRLPFLMLMIEIRICSGLHLLSRTIPHRRLLHCRPNKISECFRPHLRCWSLKRPRRSAVIKICLQVHLLLHRLTTTPATGGTVMLTAGRAVDIVINLLKKIMILPLVGLPHITAAHLPLLTHAISIITKHP